MTGAEIDSADPVPLSFTYPLRQREAAHGFASRLAAVNGRTLRQLIRHRNLIPGDVDRGDAATMRFIAAIGGADADQLLHQTVNPTPLAHRWQVVGEAFGPNVINRTLIRYCPHCVLQDLREEYGPLSARPWLRIEWLIGHFRACNSHHSVLVPVNSVKSSYGPIDFNEAIFGHLTDLQEIAADTSRSTASPYHDWIIARLEGVRDPGNWLDTLPLHVGASWCTNIGITALRQRAGMVSLADKIAASDLGFLISYQGEHSIMAHLAELNKAPRRPYGEVTPRSIYGSAYRLLELTLEEPGFEPIRRLVRDFTMATMPWKTGTNILGVNVNAPVWTTVRTAAIEAGANPVTIRKLFKRKGYGSGVAAAANGELIAAVSDVGEMIEKLRTALSFPETMQLLGIPRQRLLDLVEAGLLPLASGTSREPGDHGRFALEDIEAMMARLLEGAIEVQAPGPRQTDIMTARGIAGATSVQVFKILWDGRLNWKGRLVGRWDFDAILIKPDELTKLVRSDSTPLENLRKHEVPWIVVGLSKNAVEPLINLGLLKTLEEFSPSARRIIPVVTRASAQEFYQKYISAGELKKLHGVIPRTAKRLLARHGVYQAFDPDVINCLVFDRASVERVSSGTVGFWRPY